jgi:putative ATP-dependent endonuclease of the OLD family
MRLKQLQIQNFRNFSDITIDISNKNLIFGMNDVGKSNMMHALRMLFDSRIRNQEILDSDFHVYNTEAEIVIECCFDLSDGDDSTRKVITSAGQAISDDGSNFYVQLEVKQESNGDVLPTLRWGSNLETLIPVPTYGVSKTKLDQLFRCFYIPSGIELERTFSELKKELLADDSKSWRQKDSTTLEKIDGLTAQINEQIKNLPSVASIESAINASLETFDDQYTIEIASEQSVGGIHNHLALYSKELSDDSGRLYPTSGDGRKKKLMYAMITHLLTKSTNPQRQREIPLLLIEEPENHLFLSAQVDLSLALFGENSPIPYVFLVTHSPQLFHHISDNAQLIRLYSKSHSTTSKSAVAQVTDVYPNMRQKLLENLAHCLFVDRVLLVEGPSEKLLFDYLLDEKLKANQNLRQRIYVMPVMGAHFKDYWKILRGLGIVVMVKTDNDLKTNNNNTFSYIGFNRCIDLLNLGLPSTEAQVLQLPSKPTSELNDNTKAKAEIFDLNKTKGFVSRLEEQHIYLSKIDLENDLAEVLNKDQAWVENLQKKKWHNMYEAIAKDVFAEEIETIFASPLFKCLAEISRD